MQMAIHHQSGFSFTHSFTHSLNKQKNTNELFISKLSLFSLLVGRVYSSFVMCVCVVIYFLEQRVTLNKRVKQIPILKLQKVKGVDKREVAVKCQVEHIHSNSNLHVIIILISRLNFEREREREMKI
jgi:hypothetical protein